MRQPALPGAIPATGTTQWDPGVMPMVSDLFDRCLPLGVAGLKVARLVQDVQEPWAVTGILVLAPIDHVNEPELWPFFLKWLRDDPERRMSCLIMSAPGPANGDAPPLRMSVGLGWVSEPGKANDHDAWWLDEWLLVTEEDGVSWKLPIG
jgi:hypothetical protein